MFGSFVLAVSSITATLLPFLVAAPLNANKPRNARAPLGFDRVSITKRISEARSSAKLTKLVFLPSAAPQASHYRSIRVVNGGAIDINNVGQILTTSAVLDSNGTVHPLSPLLSSGHPYAGANPVALNDYGGVVGNYYTKDGKFSGNLAWQLENGVYKVLYFDGRSYDAQAGAINDYDLTVGNDGDAIAGSPNDGAVFSQFIPRRLLAPFNETCSFDQGWQAAAINDDNTIVGSDAGCNTVVEQGLYEAVRFSLSGYAKAILPSPPPVGYQSFAIDVNQANDIIGYAYYLDDENAAVSFLYQGASNRVLYLPRPAGEPVGQLIALSLNASDEVVGDYINYEYEPAPVSAWLYTGGKSYDLNTLLPRNSGWVIQYVTAINNAGQIVGSGIYTDPVTGVGRYAGFVMTP